MKLPQVLADPASSGRRAAPRDFGGGEGMAAMGQAVSGLGDIAGKLFEEEMSAQVSGSLADATRSLNDLGMEVQANPDHNTRNKLYAEGSQKIASDFRKGLKYPRFQGMFDERLEGTLESGRLGVKQGVRRSQVESIASTRLRAIENGAQAAAGMDDVSGAVYLEANVYPVIAEGTGSSWSALKGEALRQGVDEIVSEKRTKDKAMHFVDELMAQDLTVAEMQQGVFSIEDREERDEAWERLKIRVTARENNEARAESAQFRNEYYQVLSKDYDDIESLRDDLVTKKLDPKVTEYLLKVANAREAGVTLQATKSTVNDLREKIVNRTIRDARGLIPHLSEIGDEFTNLDAFVTKMQSGEAREIEDASSEFLKMARATLVKSTMNFVDAAGEEAFFEFQDWFTRERDKRLDAEKGTHTSRLTVVREMVNPNNQQAQEGRDYAGNHINGFRKTMQEQTDSLRKTMFPDGINGTISSADYAGGLAALTMASQAPVIAQDEAGTPVISVPTPEGNEVQVPVPQRMPGESIEEFMARQVLNTLAPPVPEDSQIGAE
jgi:hypothetical protein